MTKLALFVPGCVEVEPTLDGAARDAGPSDAGTTGAEEGLRAEDGAEEGVNGEAGSGSGSGSDLERARARARAGARGRSAACFARC